MSDHSLNITNGSDDELHIGTPNERCACCLAQFSDSRKRAGSLRWRPIEGVEIFMSYGICGKCLAAASQGGKALRRVAKRVRMFHLGEVSA